jgi:hypothetical protein
VFNLAAAGKSAHCFTVGIAQQSLLFHLSGLPLDRPERVPELLESRATTERRAHVQLAVFELPREFPNVHRAHAERPSETPARPSPV